jgi:excisionase family DNA binding protein
MTLHLRLVRNDAVIASEAIWEDREDEEDEVSVAEIAARVGRDRSTIYRWANAGLMPARKLVGRWVFERAALERWLDELRGR